MPDQVSLASTTSSAGLRPSSSLSKRCSASSLRGSIQGTETKKANPAELTPSPMGVNPTAPSPSSSSVPLPHFPLLVRLDVVPAPMPTTVPPVERAIDTAEPIATSLSGTNYPALPTIPSSNPHLPSSSSPSPPRVSRFIELFDLACPTPTAESSDRGGIVYAPHPRTRALVPVWKQPSPSAPSDPSDPSARPDESSVLCCSPSPTLLSATPPRKYSARRHSSPGNLTLSGEPPIPCHSQPNSPSHTQFESTLQFAPLLETAVDVVGRLVASVKPPAVSSSDALCSQLSLQTSHVMLKPFFLTRYVSQPSSRVSTRHAPARSSTSRTTPPIAVLRKKKRSSLNIVDHVLSPTSDSPPMGSSTSLSRAKARSNTQDITTPEKQSHRNSLSRALHFFSPFSITAPPSSSSGPHPSDPPHSFIVSSRGTGVRRKSPLRSLSSDTKESLTRRTAIPEDSEYDAPSPPQEAEFLEADKTMHITTASAQPTAGNGICSSPVYPSLSPLSSSSRPRSTSIQGENTAPMSSRAAPHPPIRSLTSPPPRATHGQSTRRASDRSSSRTTSLHLHAPAFLRTMSGGGEAGVLGLRAESGGPRSRPRKLSKSSDTQARRRQETKRRATEQTPRSFVSRLFAHAE